MVERGVILDRYPQVGAHAREHAVQTADLALNIAGRPEYKGLFDIEDFRLIERIALLHDIGYKKRPYWSSAGVEHPQAALEDIDESLSDFDPVRRAMAILIIINHDATNHAFPSFPFTAEINRMGLQEFYGVCFRPPGALSDDPSVPNSFFENVPDNYLPMLQVIQEADALLGSIERTYKFSVDRGVPVTADDGGIPGIGMLMWQISALANVILAAKRALLDAYTKEGQEAAWRMFVEAQDFARGKIGSENGSDLLREEDVRDIIWQRKTLGERFNPNVRITQAFPLEGVHYVVQGLGLLRFPKGFQLKFKSRLIDTDRYKQRKVLPQQELNLLEKIREYLIRNYAFDILTETDGVLRVIADVVDKIPGAEYTLIPPIISEGSTNLVLNPASQLWIDLAIKLKIPKIRVLLVS